MPLTPATLTVNFTSNYKGIHRICWRVQDSGDEYDCSLLTSCAGNGATCSLNIPIVVDNEDCGTPVIYEGYIQPICNDITSEDGRLPFEIGYYPEDCPDDPCFNAPNFNCIIYLGDPILCGAEVVINTGDDLATALTSLSDRICDIVDNNNYISNIELSGTNLIFTNESSGTSPAFEGTIDFSSVIPSISVYSNSIFVDARYGDDSTGEYGNFAKPFKTIAGALTVALDYMENNPIYNISPFYFDANHTDVAKEIIPRITIHIAPGFYNAQDDIAYMQSEGFDYASQQISSFNLMFNFIDYNVSPGASLYNYSFTDYRFFNSPSDTNIVPTITNVFGDGVLISDIGARNTQPPSDIVHPNYYNHSIVVSDGSELNIMCYKTNLGAYVFGGKFTCKADTVVFDNKKVAGGFGTNRDDMYYIDNEYNDGSDPDFKSTDSYFYLSCRDFIVYRKYNLEVDGFDVFSGIFQIYGGDVHCYIQDLYGADVSQFDSDWYKEYKSSNTSLWVENYFVLNQDKRCGACSLISYAENYHPKKYVYNFKIDKMVVNTLVSFTGSVYESDASLRINIDINHLILEPWAKNPFTNKEYYYFGMAYDMGLDCVVNTKIGHCENKIEFDEDVSIFFYANFFKVLSFNYKHYCRDSNFKLFGQKDINIFRPEVGEDCTPDLILDNIKAEITSSSLSGSFILANDALITDLDIRIYQNCFSNEPNNGSTTVNNLITGTSLIVDTDVKIF
jgi:hypothetical protein